MTALWHFYWPVFSAAMVLGLIAGVIAFRKPTKRERYLPLGVGVIASLVSAAVWHGPAGAGERLAPRSKPTTESPALVSSRAMMLPVQPMPTSTASTCFSFLAMARP